MTIFKRIEAEKYIEGYEETVDLKDFCLCMRACVYVYVCVCVCVSMIVCMCVYEKERKREEERDREKERGARERGMQRCKMSVQK